jgi:hypothetical protein
MSIYGALNIIDEFEAKFGNSESVTRACDLMVSYLSKMEMLLSEIAMRGLQAAIRYRMGVASSKDLCDEERVLSNRLKEKPETTTYIDTEYHEIHAVKAVLSFYQHPIWGGGASEVVSNFWDVAAKLKSDETVMNRLLREHFSQH